MTTVGSYAAKTHLPALLKRVAKGETIVITRRGKAIAQLTQPPRPAAKDVHGLLARLSMLRKGNKLGKDSIRSLIDEGRRF